MPPVSTTVDLGELGLKPGGGVRFDAAELSFLRRNPDGADTQLRKEFGNIGEGKDSEARQRRAIEAHAKAAGIDTVWLVGRWALYSADDPTNPSGRYLLADRDNPMLWSRADSARALTQLLGHTAENYSRAGIKVVLVDQVPSQSLMIDRKLKWLSLQPDLRPLGEVIRQSSVMAADFAALRSAFEPALTAQQARGIQVLRFDDLFRDGDRYLWGGPGAAWYRDANHLSSVGALRLTPRLNASFDAAARTFTGTPPAGANRPRRGRRCGP